MFTQGAKSWESLFCTISPSETENASYTWERKRVFVPERVTALAVFLQDKQGRVKLFFYHSLTQHFFFREEELVLSFGTLELLDFPLSRLPFTVEGSLRKHGIFAKNVIGTTGPKVACQLKLLLFSETQVS